MSFDPSRQLYPHHVCGTLPCSCEREHGRVEVQVIKCSAPQCPRTFFTMNEMQEHHLDAHEDKGYVRKVEGVVFTPTISGSNGVHG